MAQFGNLGNKAIRVTLGFDFVHGSLDRKAGAAPSVEVWNERGGHASGVLAQKPCLPHPFEHLDPETRFIVIGQQDGWSASRDG